MKKYKIDFLANTITMSKEFAIAVNSPTSEEYKLLQQVITDYPAMQIIRKNRRPSKTANPFKNLTYANMERYINVYDNADKLLEMFKQVKELSKTQTNRYRYVKSWFVEQFPSYKELPDFTSLKLVAEVVPAPIAELDRVSGF